MITTTFEKIGNILNNILTEDSIIVIKECKDCKQCCDFSSYYSYKITLQDSIDHFGFDKPLADLFFKKRKNDYYFIDKTCIQFDTNRLKCSLFGTYKYPFSCSIYPFILAKDQNNNINLYIDHNCPYKEKAIKQIDKIFNIIEKYKNNLNIFNKKILQKIGYKLKLVKKNII